MSITFEYGGSSADALSSAEFARWVEMLATVDADAGDAELIDRISGLERMKSACSAVQASLTVAFVESQTAGLPPAKARDERVHRSIAAQVALTRRDTPVRGGRHVGFAKALVREMPQTFRALQAGEISEWRATLVVRETACLSVEHRQQVDAELAGQLGGLGDRGAERFAAKIAQRLDPGACVKRNRKAVTERRVSIRPAPDTMNYVSALLPVAHGVAVYAALLKHADTARAIGDPRSRGQVMADELVSRVTQPAATVADPVVGDEETVDEETVDIAGSAGQGDPARTAPGDSAAENPSTADTTDYHDGPVDAAAPTDAETRESASSPGHDCDIAIGAASVDDCDVANGAASEDDCDVVNGGPSEDDCDIANGAASDQDSAAPVVPASGDISGPASVGNAGPAAIPAGVNLDIQLVMTGRTLFDGDNEPAHLVGYGPIPAPLARQLIRDTSPTVKAWVRRLYTDPESGHLINGDARRRFFGHAERQFLVARDQFCRSPYCDAPIRHGDHVEGHPNGPAELTKGQGLCENCNYVKEAPGWSSRTEPGSNTITVTTPTGHTHHSDPPPPPRSAPWDETPATEISTTETSTAETRLAELIRATKHRQDATRLDIVYPEIRYRRQFNVA